MTPCQNRYKKALQGGLRECNNLPQPPKTKDVGIGLQKIVAFSQSSSQCLLVSTVFGMVSSLHPRIFILVLLFFYAGLALSAIIVAHGEIITRMYVYTYVHTCIVRANCNRSCDVYVQ